MQQQNILEQFNFFLFNIINASANPNALVLNVAKFFGQYLIYLVPLALIICLIDKDKQNKKTVLMALIILILSLLAGWLIAKFWFHPRPFMIPLGNTFIAHSGSGSFPSTHLSIICAVAFPLFFNKSTKKTGLLLVVCILPIAWARVYLGVHFPLDMVGAIAVCLFITFVVRYLINTLVRDKGN